MAATAAIRSLMRTLHYQGDEGTLLGAVATGDQNAFAELVRRYGPLTLGVCRRVLGSTADADDAFHRGGWLRGL